MMLKTVYHTGPVTGLHCYGELLLSGIGSHVNVYCVSSQQLKQSVCVLPARVIHGFREDRRTGKLCVFGQKCIRLVQHAADWTGLEVLKDMWEFSDWIWDMVWIEGGSEICIATAHNVIITFNIDKELAVNSVHCSDKCILYCAKFLTSTSDCLVLAAGTVFNQVVIWSPQGEISAENRIEPFHRLTGHQGVIFNVDYSAKHQLVCSVSDDRSIRLYSVKFPCETATSDIKAWERMESCLLHVLYGHSARVWDVRLLTSSFVSIAEDSSCCVWSYKGQILQQFKGHKGKSIWSICVDKGEKFVFTGGEDNSVRMWSLLASQGKEANTKLLDLKLEGGDFPRNTRLLDINRVLVMTNAGHLLCLNTDTGERSVLLSSPAFSSYTVMDVSTSGQLVAIGNIHGSLCILDIQDNPAQTDIVKHNVTVCEGKVFSVVWLDSNNLLTTAPYGLINLWSISKTDVRKFMTLDLPPSKQHWVTTATLIETHELQNFICGDRMGSVFLYKLDVTSQQGELQQTFHKIHGKGGVTHISCHGNQIYSAGRDGHYRVYSWTDIGQLELLNSNRVCKGMDWIEKLEIQPAMGDVLVQGFYTNLFIVWSVKHNQKLLEVDCGGGHRAWDYYCHGDSAMFVYVKAREVKVTSIVNRSNQTILKTALHGRELCDSKLVATGQDKNGQPVYAVVTCSEDTAVCLSTLHYNIDLLNLKVHHTLTGHISSVRCLEISHSSLPSQHSTGNRRLIFSGGGRAQLKIWRVDIKFCNSILALRTEYCHEAATLAEDLPVICKCEDSSCDTCSSKDLEGQKYNKTTGPQKEGLQIQNHNTNLNNLHKVSGFSEQTVSRTVVKDFNEQEGTWNVPGENQDISQATRSSSCAISSENKTDRVNMSVTKDEAVDCKIVYEYVTGLQLSELSGRRVKKPWRYPVKNSDPETRILDLSVMSLPRSSSVFLIAAACSDGLLRVFSFDEDSREITLHGSSDFHNHCVLKVSHMIHTDQSDTASSPNSQSKILFLSSATDGKVAIWDVTHFYENALAAHCEKKSKFHEQDCDMSDSEVNENTCTDKGKAGGEKPELQPCGCLEMHQSGINSIHIENYGENKYILVTGGDDNALKVRIVTMETDDKVKLKVISAGDHNSAHCAQITGVRYLGNDHILSASIDQRVCVWRLMNTGETIQLQLVESHFTSVSDVANIDVWSDSKDRFALTCGNGLELLKLDSATDKHINQTNFCGKVVTHM